MPHGLHVLDQFSPADVASIRALADEIEAKSGTNPFGEVTWTGLDGRGTLGDRGVLLPGPTRRRGRRVRAPRAPPARRVVGRVRGSSRGPTDALGALLAEAIAVVAREGGGHLTLWLHGEQAADEPGAAGFVPERELLEMRVPLPLPAGPRWPDGITVRNFVVGQDEDDWLAVNNRAFAGHPEQGGWGLDTLLQREQSAWFEPEGFLLAFAATIRRSGRVLLDEGPSRRAAQGTGGAGRDLRDRCRSPAPGHRARARPHRRRPRLAGRARHHRGHALRRRRQRRRRRAVPVARLRHPPARPGVRDGRDTDRADRPSGASGP